MLAVDTRTGLQPDPMTTRTADWRRRLLLPWVGCVNSQRDVVTAVQLATRTEQRAPTSTRSSAFGQPRPSAELRAPGGEPEMTQRRKTAVGGQ